MRLSGVCQFSEYVDVIQTIVRIKYQQWTRSCGTTVTDELMNEKCHPVEAKLSL
jgi:hypothetical protein